MSVTTTAPVADAAEARTTSLWRTGARAGICAVALGADVPLEIDGEQIPLLGFAQMTLLCTAIGVVLAKALIRWTAKPQHKFVAVTVALTALSIVPDLTAPASAATKAVLIATHVVAAAIVIPAVAKRLPVAR